MLEEGILGITRTGPDWVWVWAFLGIWWPVPSPVWVFIASNPDRTGLKPFLAPARFMNRKKNNQEIKNLLPLVSFL
jgi:hypothetical protein